MPPDYATHVRSRTRYVRGRTFPRRFPLSARRECDGTISLRTHGSTRTARALPRGATKVPPRHAHSDTTPSCARIPLSYPSQHAAPKLIVWSPVQPAISPVARSSSSLRARGRHTAPSGAAPARRAHPVRLAPPSSIDRPAGRYPARDARSVSIPPTPAMLMSQSTCSRSDFSARAASSSRPPPRQSCSGGPKSLACAPACTCGSASAPAAPTA